LPLGIELAAALLRHAPLGAVVEHVAADLAYVDRATTRHGRGGMVDRLSWSVTPLEPELRLILRAVAVFRGGCSLEALRAVLAATGMAPEAVDGGLHELVRRSLIRLDRRQGGRYTIMEPIRRLVEQQVPEQADVLRAAHFATFRTMLVDARALMESAEQAVWYERIGHDFANFTVLVEHGLTTGDESILDVAHGLADFSFRRGRAQEGLGLLASMVDRFGTVPELPCRPPPSGRGVVRGGNRSPLLRGDTPRHPQEPRSDRGMDVPVPGLHSRAATHGLSRAVTRTSGNRVSVPTGEPQTDQSVGLRLTGGPGRTPIHPAPARRDRIVGQLLIQYG